MFYKQQTYYHLSTAFGKERRTNSKKAKQKREEGEGKNK
jgi:hypothetical protein